MSRRVRSRPDNAQIRRVMQGRSRTYRMCPDCLWNGYIHGDRLATGRPREPDQVCRRCEGKGILRRERGRGQQENHCAAVQPAMGEGIAMQALFIQGLRANDVCR